MTANLDLQRIILIDWFSTIKYRDDLIAEVDFEVEWIWSLSSKYWCSQFDDQVHLTDRFAGQMYPNLFSAYTCLF